MRGQVEFVRWIGAERPGMSTTLVAVALVAGCSGGQIRSAAPHTADGLTSSTAPTTSSTPPPADVRPPREHACYRLAAADLDDAHNTAGPVSCKRRHTAQTYLVRRLPREVVGNPTAVDTKAVVAAADRVCAKALPGYVGGSRSTRAMSQVAYAWFVPQEDAFASGARWVRCDMVTRADDRALTGLPRSADGLLDTADALDDWGTCARASARSLQAGLGQRICSRPHNWRAVSTRTLGATGDPWPGARDVRRGVLSRCEAAVRSYSGNAVESVEVGWLPPTHRKWRAGKRLGICWSRST